MMKSVRKVAIIFEDIWVSNLLLKGVKIYEAILFRDTIPILLLLILGTVGVTSGMYGITKVMKELQDEAEDIVEYVEDMNEFNAFLNQADTACYSANFVEFSAAKTKPEEFYRNAKTGKDQ